MDGQYWFYSYGISLECYYSVVTEVNELITPDNDVVTFYPNPAREIINIDCKNLLQTGNIQVELFDQSGKRVKSAVFSDGSSLLKFDVNGLAGGFYILKIFDRDNLTTRKVIISE